MLRDQRTVAQSATQQLISKEKEWDAREAALSQQHLNQLMEERRRVQSEANAQFELHK